MKSSIVVGLILAGTTAFGQTITNFSATNAVNGKTFSLKNVAASKGIVIVFISNICPYDDYYYDRLNALVSAYAQKIPIVFVNPHLGDGESAVAMKATAAAKQFTVPYLEDKDQKIMRSLKATKSPEAFVLQPTGDQYSVFYRGAIDDNAQVATDVHERYLQAAIDALIAGQSPPRPVRPTGCIIRQK